MNRNIVKVAALESAGLIAITFATWLFANGVLPMPNRGGANHAREVLR